MTKKSEYRKVTLTMPDDMLVYLESIGQRSSRTGGLKLAKTEIVRSFITLLKKLEVDYSGLKDKKDLLGRIEQAMREYKG